MFSLEVLTTTTYDEWINEDMLLGTSPGLRADVRKEKYLPGFVGDRP